MFESCTGSCSLFKGVAKDPTLNPFSLNSTDLEVLIREIHFRIRFAITGVLDFRLPRKNLGSI